MMSTRPPYTRRFLARFVIEAETPLAVGSGDKDITTDRLVAKDVNGLPYIPATSIAGVVRSMVADKLPKDFFGWQLKQKGHGSEIIFTDAQILNSEGRVIDGLDDTWQTDPLLKVYDDLPIRQHVRIGADGAAVKNGKFDEQVVFAGSRFCFEMEAVATSESLYDEAFRSVMEALSDASFRLGGGTRKGFGAIKIIDGQSFVLDLTKPDQLDRYLSKSSSLAASSFGPAAEVSNEKSKSEGWTIYTLSLTPRDFMLFGSGFGNEDADMTPVRERKVVWEDGKGKLTDEWVLVPATSVKGALAHRIAFHWNKDHGYYAGSAEAKTAADCPAVHALFGKAEMDKSTRGNVIFSDVHVEKGMQDKVLNHVSIDRLTGGAIDGALFSENVIFSNGVTIAMSICVNTSQVAEVLPLFEKALNDLCDGLLPLGGGTNRGNGFFMGSWAKNERV